MCVCVRYLPHAPAYQCKVDWRKKKVTDVVSVCVWGTCSRWHKQTSCRTVVLDFVMRHRSVSRGGECKHGVHLNVHAVLKPVMRFVWYHSIVVERYIHIRKAALHAKTSRITHWLLNGAIIFHRAAPFPGQCFLMGCSQFLHLQPPSTVSPHSQPHPIPSLLADTQL